MELYQLRVMNEHDDLDYKVAKLEAFTISLQFAELPVDEQRRLHRQLKAMVEYRESLEDRINHFERSPA